MKPNVNKKYRGQKQQGDHEKSSLLKAGGKHTYGTFESGTGTGSSNLTVSPPVVRPPTNQGAPGLSPLTKRDLQVLPLEGEQQPRIDPNLGKTLESVLMNTGSVTSLLPGGGGWPGIAAKLKSIFLPAARAKNGEFTAALCEVKYAPGEQRSITPITKEAGNQINSTADFIESFMRANGQWTYIENQDWWKSGDYVISIDVNYYPYRSESFTEALKVHKDTGGDNIFVNLIFDNVNPIEKTELYVDLEEPSQQRAKWQSDLLPKSHQAELKRVRETFQVDKGKRIAGGVTNDKYAYLSWADDLVWHATPVAKARVVYSAVAAADSYKQLDLALDKDLVYFDKNLKTYVVGTEILATMAEKGTHLDQWLKQQDLKPQDIDVETAKKIWKELYQGPDGEARFVGDAKIRAAAGDWRLTGQYSQANAPDKRIKGGRNIAETPVVWSKLRRTNSDPAIQRRIQQVRKDNQNQARSFLRTWVRIVPKKDTEVGKDVTTAK